MSSDYPELAARSNVGDLKDGVSVVVCVHRDVQKLDRLFKCLFVQSFPLYEIVVVNDGPDPGIAEYLRAVRIPVRRSDGNPAPTTSLCIVEFDSSKKTTHGKKAPLTAGIVAAQYDWLLLTDGDCVMGPEWITEMRQQVSPGIKMILGVAPFFPKPGLCNLLQRFDGFIISVQYISAALRGKPFMGVGRNLLYHRSLFEKAKGFSSHAHLVSGDDDLFMQSVADRHNTSVCTNPSAFVFSEAADSWTAWIQQKRRHLSASSGYSQIAKLQTTTFALSWIVVWLGIPFILCCCTFWTVTGIVAGAVLWSLFAYHAHRLYQRKLIPTYPFIAVCYCVMLCTFAILLTIRQPKTWMKS